VWQAPGREDQFEESEAHGLLGLVFLEPAEELPSGESGWARESAGAGGGASGGLWARPGVSDDFPKGGHGYGATHDLWRGSDRSCGPFCGRRRIGCRQR